MPEGDTLFRTATVLRKVLVGERVTDARGRPGGARLDLVVGSTVDEVRTIGKHLIVGFDRGLSLHTHLGMHGSWHRYRPDERWRRPADTAVAVLRTPRSVAVCFDAPVVELIDSRALSLHPGLARLGPDLLAPHPDIDTATRRLLDPGRADRTIAEALLDQSAVAGIGNVYRSEVLSIARLDPFLPVRALAPDTIGEVLRKAAALLRANTEGGARTTIDDPSSGRSGGPRSDRLWVYGRAGRPCRRCGALIRTTSLGSPPRRLYWCPVCQAPGPRGAADRGREDAPDEGQPGVRDVGPSRATDAR